MTRLKKILDEPGFRLGVELVSTRGTIEQSQAQRLQVFGNALATKKSVDWISITDNAGGHPAISPSILATPLQALGKEVIIHMTCKDFNRNGLESKAWELNSSGLKNILAITGDYPTTGIGGSPKPVFDVDSVGLLHILNMMNEGLHVNSKKFPQLQPTHFYTGAVVSNFKKYENELMPQYIKLLKKIEMGAQFIINQVGFDAAKMSELIHFQKYKALGHIHFIGNVFVLSKFSSSLFANNKIPGVVLTPKLYKKCAKAAQSPDKGKAFFLEMAAQMMAIYKGLGYKGAYLGGIHNIADLEHILEIYNAYTEDDWKLFVKDFQFAQKDEFFFFKRDYESGLTIEDQVNPQVFEKGEKTKNINLNYAISKRFHSLMFTEGAPLYKVGQSLCSKSKHKSGAPAWLAIMEKTGKKWLYDCQECGDCSLAETGYVCPESHCSKNQRNGPCGGSHQLTCEAKDYDCIWTKAYDRLKRDGDIWSMLDHAPVMQNHELKSTSAWSNYWLKKDHNAYRE